MKLLLTDKTKITNRKELLKYLLKTYLNLVSFVVHYKRFSLFSFSSNKLTTMENQFFYYQRCKNENFNFYGCFPIFMDYYDNERNSVLQESQKRLYSFECKQYKMVIFIDFKQVANEKCVVFLKQIQILIKGRTKFYEE